MEEARNTRNSPSPSPPGPKQAHPPRSTANTAAVSRRLQKELMSDMMSGDVGISAFPEAENIFSWVGQTCFHPNVDQFGNICLDILQDMWSSAYDIRTILLSIQSLLGEPNNESPLNCQAAILWSNQEEYKKMVQRLYIDGAAAAECRLPQA